MKRLSKIALFCLLVVGVPSSAFSQASSKTPKNLFLDPQTSLVQNRYYKQVSLPLDSETLIEKVKIKFLIESMRLSPFTFIRNGNAYTGERAAQHMLMKYGLAANRIQTARNFINYLASSSSETGKPYLVKFPDGKMYPTRDLLYNELERLERSLEING